MRLHPERAPLALAVVTAALLALPSTSTAAPPPVQQFRVQSAGNVLIIGGGHLAFVADPGPPPSLREFREGAGGWREEAPVLLPEGTDPGGVARDQDGYVHVVDQGAVKRDIVINAFLHPGTIKEIIPLPDPQDRPTAVIFGFHADLGVYFGTDTEAGHVRYGPTPDALGSSLTFPEDARLDAATLLPDWRSVKTNYQILSLPRRQAGGPGAARAARAKSPAISSVFLVLDANKNRLFEVSDKARPALIRSVPGPPAATAAFSPRDVAVSPLNYKRRFKAAGSHPILVPVPGVGNVFVLRGGTWTALSSTAFGRPQAVAASCHSVAVTDFANGVVTFFNFKQPKKAVCEELVNVGLAGKRVGSPKVVVKPYGNFKAAISLDFKLPGRADTARKVKTKTRRVRLKAGRIKAVRLKFSRRKAAAIAAALRHRRSLKGTVKLRLKNRASGKFTVKRRIRIRRG
jgi:hypothetical protein